MGKMAYKKGTVGYYYTKKGCKKSADGRWSCPRRSKKTGWKGYYRREGKRCPKDTYVKRFGKSAGMCVGSKEKANRVPCSFMTRRGRQRSSRCKAKS